MKTKPSSSSSSFTLWNQRSLAEMVGVALLGSAALLGACSSSSKPAPKATKAATETSVVTSGSAEPTSDSVTAIDAGSQDTALSPATKSVKASPDSTTPTVPASDLASPAPTSSAPSAPSAQVAQSVVLPIDANPIANTATAECLKIDSVLVENNVDPGGKTADDHLEITLSNAGAVGLGGVEIFYTFTDPTTKVTESYYTKLPSDFTVPANGKRVVHFDPSDLPNHFPVNKFSLYYTDKNALDVTVVVSAQGAAVQTTKLQKDAGGAEAAD